MWGNPYTSPPEGWPREILGCRLPRGVPPTALEEYAKQLLGTPWSLVWRGVVGGPGGPDYRRKTWPLARKQAMRRGNLRRRLMRKSPLFADKMYSETVANNREYYGEE